jgi:hypothetical protein
MVTWFSRYLNWSIVIFTVIASVISHYAINVLLLITHTPWWGPNLPPNAVDVFLPAFTSFSFDAELLLSDILLIPCFNWILLKKKQNRTFLLYFIVFLIIDIPVFLSYVISFHLPGIILFFRTIAVMIWFAGWIILIKLKTKQQ